jgi:hypothetical protein
MFVNAWKQRAWRAALAIGQMIYGATVYEMVRDLNKERAQLEHMFVPPYYTLRLLPYVVPCLPAWRRSILRERDLTDLCDQEIT